MSRWLHRLLKKKVFKSCKHQGRASCINSQPSTKSKNASSCCRQGGCESTFIISTNMRKQLKRRKRKSSILPQDASSPLYYWCLPGTSITLFKMTKGFWVSLFDLDKKQVRRNSVSIVEGTNDRVLESLVQHHNHEFT
jgi:hypothetical protein